MRGMLSRPNKRSLKISSARESLSLQILNMQNKKKLTIIKINNNIITKINLYKVFKVRKNLTVDTLQQNYSINFRAYIHHIKC